MSLVKLALINPLPIIMTGFGARAAKSGDPFKYIMSKSEGPFRKHLQRFTLAGLANTTANIRKGMVQDSTSVRGALLDSQLGQFGRMGGVALEDIYNKKTPANMIYKEILDNVITNDGKFHIENIEKGLNRANTAYKWLGNVKKAPVTVIGSASGAAIGYNKGDNEHKLKSTLKGGLIGGAIGGSARQGLNFAHKELSFIPKAHKEYFADPYWRKQLEAANTPVYNRVGKHLLANQLTAWPEDRARRIAASDKWQKRGDDFWKDMKANFN